MIRNKIAISTVLYDTYSLSVPGTRAQIQDNTNPISSV